MKNNIIVALIIVLLLGGGYALYRQRFIVSQTVQSLTIPKAVEYDLVVAPVVNDQDQPVESDKGLDETETPQDLQTGTIDPTEPVPPPQSINLAIPFTSQAPQTDWGLPYQEACEEASVLMAAAFLNAEVDLSTPVLAEQEILSFVALEETQLGAYLDTTVEETIRVANARFPSLVFTSVNNPTIDEIKTLLANGVPVIVPAAGRKLQNPFYSGVGPLYHMLVLRGYTSTSFITNDPGTRRGEQYLYTFDTIMEAMGDWNGGNPAQGAKMIIVVHKR